MLYTVKRASPEKGGGGADDLEEEHAAGACFEAAVDLDEDGVVRLALLREGRGEGGDAAGLERGDLGVGV